MLLGNFKRGKDKKKRKSRGIKNLLTGAGLGAAGLGAGAYMASSPKQQILSATRMSGVNLGKATDKEIWNNILKSSVGSEEAAKGLKKMALTAKSRQLKSTGKAALLGLGLGAATAYALSGNKDKKSRKSR